MKARLGLLGSAVAALLVFAPGSAHAAAWTADDQDPDVNGCAYVADLTRLDEAPLSGSVDGYVQTLWSPTCGVVYTRLVLTHPDPTLAVDLEVDRWGTAGSFATHGSADGTAFWSNEIGAVPGQDCVHSNAWVSDATGATVATAQIASSCPAGY